jgi:hypothetical protein
MDVPLSLMIFSERTEKIRFFIKSSHKCLGDTIQGLILSTFSDDSRIKHKFTKKKCNIILIYL